VVVEDGGDDEEEEEDVEVAEEVEAYRGKRVAVDRKPELLHRQCRIDIEGFIGRPERKRCYERRMVEKLNRGEIGFGADGKPIG
jgi:hypothetical protein